MNLNLNFPAYTGIVSSSILENALDFLIDVEFSGFWDEPEEYANATHIEEQIENARFVIRQFGEQITPLNMDNMYKNYDYITQIPKYTKSLVIMSVVRSSVRYNWDGIHDWRA
jgi:hypothetical protein